MKVQPLLCELQSWRDELAALPPEVQDKEIWFIFQKQASADAKPQNSRRQKHCPPHADCEDGFSTGTESAEKCGDEKASISTSEPSGSDSTDGRKPEKVAASVGRKRYYSQRIGSKQPSVRIDRVLRGADFNACVCYNAALFVFGLGGPRVKRVTWLQFWGDHDIEIVQQT